VLRGAKSRMRRTETPKLIWIKFCTVAAITNVVTYTNFGDHRLRGFWVAGGQIFPLPIHFDRRSYNTLTLPCECVHRSFILNRVILIICKAKPDVAHLVILLTTLIVNWSVVSCLRTLNPVICLFAPQQHACSCSAPYLGICLLA